MKQFYHYLLFFSITAFSIQEINAQESTFESVTQIFSQSCAYSSCHGADAAHPLKLAGTMDDIYANLINVDPTNPSALAKGNKLVVPGDPTKSFLYRKVNGDLYEMDQLHSQEGTSMPTQTELSDVEKETIRQWILWGAPEEGMVHNEAALVEYYEDGNGLDRIEPLEPPAQGEGFQFYLGTLFLEPEEEIETMKIEVAPLGDSLEIVGFEVRMSDFSHHYGIARILNEFDSTVPPGFSIVDNLFTALNFFENSEYITGSQLPENNYNLPENTAYRWEGSNSLTLNFHIKNYSTAAILPAEAYVNLYVQPKNTAEKEMRTTTLNYGPDGNVFALQIEGGGEDTTFVMEHFEEGSEEVIDIWRLMPHTHAYAVDYDIFLRNEDGTKGEQVYEGFYNYELDFDQGFYDYTHATFRSFEDPLRVKLSEGLIFEATYNNPGTETVGFGPTTDDEMFIGYYLYTEADTTEVEVEDTLGAALNNINLLDAVFYPNPVKEVLFIDMEPSPEATLFVYDIQGKLIKTQEIAEGNHFAKINVESLSTGTYFVQIRDEQSVLVSQKFVKAH